MSHPEVAARTGPLAGIQVVELTLMAAGPWTGVLLGKLGADVVKIESPAGDGTRWAHPSQQGMGTNFIAMNVGKRDVTLDLKDPDDLAVAHALVSESDVFLQNLTGGVADRLGVGYEELHARNPRLIHCSISGYGTGGPLGRERCGAPYIEAFSGLARLTGRQGAELEQFRFTGLMDLVTASVATESIIAALVDRKRTGAGQRIDVAMLEAALELQFTRFSEYLESGVVPRPQGSASSVVAPDSAFPALDRPVFVTAHNDAEWEACCQALARPDLLTDPRFESNAARVSNRDSLTAELSTTFREKPAIWWLRALTRHRVPVAVERDFDTLRNMVTVRDNEMIATVGTEWGAVDVGGLPWKFSRTPGTVLPAPVPGADTDWARARAALIGSPPRATAPAIESVGDSDSEVPPLTGIRVVELHSGVAGALAALRLGDLGAEVIKVEPQDGDWLRSIEPRHPDADYSIVFGALNRGKRSVQLSDDPQTNDELLRHLLAGADVVIEDNTDGTTSEATFGDLEHVRDRARQGKGRTIWLELTDYGSAGVPASELTVQATAGYTRWIGRFDGEPERLGYDVASTSTAIFAAEAALAALLARDREGAQYVALSRLNSLLSLASIHLAAQTDPDAYEGQRVGGEFFEPMTGWSTGREPIVFQFGGSAGKDGRPGWTDFMSELDADWIFKDPRFASDLTGRESTGHGKKSEECKVVYEEIFSGYSDRDLVTRIRALGGEAATFNTYEELMSEPQLAHLGTVQTLGESRSQNGGTPALSFPAHFSSLVTCLRAGVAPLGADNDEATGGADAPGDSRLLPA